MFLCWALLLSGERRCVYPFTSPVAVRRRTVFLRPNLCQFPLLPTSLQGGGCCFRVRQFIPKKLRYSLGLFHGVFYTVPPSYKDDSTRSMCCSMRVTGRRSGFVFSATLCRWRGISVHATTGRAFCCPIQEQD